MNTGTGWTEASRLRKVNGKDVEKVGTILAIDGA